jgi:tubulin alpha
VGRRTPPISPRYFSIGRRLLDGCLDGIRRLTENTNNFEGFLFFTVRRRDKVRVWVVALRTAVRGYGSMRHKTSILVYPCAETSSNVVEPYNAVLSTHSLLDCTDISNGI